MISRGAPPHTHTHTFPPHITTPHLPPSSHIPPVHPQPLAIAPAAPERRAQGGILVGEIQDVLGETGALDDAPDFDGAFFLDEFADGVEEVGGELRAVG